VRGLTTNRGLVRGRVVSPPWTQRAVTQLKKAGAVKSWSRRRLTEFANFLTPGMPAGYSSAAGRCQSVRRVADARGFESRPLRVLGGRGSPQPFDRRHGDVGIDSPARPFANSAVVIKPTLG